MLCSARELKLSDDHGGLLDPRRRRAGRPATSASSCSSTTRCFTLKLTPNLGHCLSVLRRRARSRGVDRRAAARRRRSRRCASTATRQAAGRRSRRPICAGASPAASCATSTRARTTPAWMVDRLARCGQRTVTPLVDISNYVMFEYGRPSHIFDLDKIHGGLDRALGPAGRVARSCSTAARSRSTSTVGVIADAARVESLAGIMGGDATAVSDDDAQRLRRGRVLVARGGRRALAPLQLLDRRRPSLRARRRPGDDGRAHRAHHAADRRDLRRRNARGPIDDQVVDAAEARRRSRCASRAPPR